MKILTYTLFALFLSAKIIAVEIPNQFEDGQVTSASQMNENFQALKVEIEALKAQLEQSQTPPKIEFTGFSQSVIGDSGIFNLNQACDTSFPGSRICSAEELTFSNFSSNDELPTGSAFITREISAGNGQYGGTFYKIRHCSTDTGTRGPGIHNGEISNNILCESSYPVACCK